MKKLYIREVRHIITKYSLTKKSTGYRMNSHSNTSKIINDMINWNWLECERSEGPFLFVVPTKSFLSRLGVEDAEFKNPANIKSKNYLTQNSSSSQQMETNSILILA